MNSDGPTAGTLGAGTLGMEPSMLDVDRRAPLEATLNMVIALRVKETRQHKGLPIRTLSDRTGISKGMLSKIENAQVSPSLATLARLAEALDTPLTAFFRGFDEERDAVFVKAGHGAEIRREGIAAGHHYQQLGTMRGQHRRMTPQLVTLTEPAEQFPLYQHPGTEFLYMLSGMMAYGHGRAVYVLEPGDALQFDGEASHGPVELIKLPVKFLSVTAVGTVHD
ncbi:MAG: transcriptional regulator, family [Actinomycetia bacterium]|nr:transcriptional regulator, family [Actinomycetes bacterium]